MAIKRKGVLATPGVYRYGDVREEKTSKELKEAATRQPIIMLTYGHPEGGFPKAKDFIGTVSQKWDEEKQKVMGDFWFYDEFLPSELSAKLDGPIQISPGLALDDVTEDVQKGIVYTHVAILKDEEDPICPLNECGVNVRMESNSSNNRLEQKTEINTPEKPPEDVPAEAEPVKVEEKYATIEDLSALKQEIKEAILAITPKEPEPVTEPPPPQPKAQVEAEVIIPADTGETSKYGPDAVVEDDGWLKIVPTKRKIESD